jgi:group I intron endonuclease
MGIIYCYHNKTNGKRYIGQTIHPDQRKRCHLSESKFGSDYYFHRAIRKHGINKFDYTVLAETDNPAQLTELETHWITYHNTIWPNGYNQKMPDISMTEEIKRKISESQKKRMAARTSEQKKLENEKRSKSLMGHTQGDNQKRIVAEKLAKTYRVFNPDGSDTVITNLQKFARENNLDQGNLLGTARYTTRFHKGYRVSRITI